MFGGDTTFFQPSHWVVLKFNNNKESYYKLFVGWPYGGPYEWRLNSQITSCSRWQDDRLLFHGLRTNKYIVELKDYGFNRTMTSVFDRWLDQIKTLPKTKQIDIEVLEAKTAEQWLEYPWL